VKGTTPEQSNTLGLRLIRKTLRTVSHTKHSTSIGRTAVPLGDRYRHRQDTLQTNYLLVALNVWRLVRSLNTVRSPPVLAHSQLGSVDWSSGELSRSSCEIASAASTVRLLISSF
jgi:hypothetical protein